MLSGIEIFNFFVSDQYSRNAPKVIFNLYGVSFIYTKFGTFTTFSAIATKGSIYLLDQTNKVQGDILFFRNSTSSKQVQL